MWLKIMLLEILPVHGTRGWYRKEWKETMRRVEWDVKEDREVEDTIKEPESKWPEALSFLPLRIA